MPTTSEFRVVEYEARHADAFRDLNLAWIQASLNLWLVSLIGPLLFAVYAYRIQAKSGCSRRDLARRTRVAALGRGA